MEGGRKRGREEKREEERSQASFREGQRVLEWSLKEQTVQNPLLHGSQALTPLSKRMQKEQPKGIFMSLAAPPARPRPRMPEGLWVLGLQLPVLWLPRLLP